MIKRIESGISGAGLGPNCLSRIRELAISLGLKGIAFTRNDGSIKVIAEGEESNLIDFTKRLPQISTMASVENFYVKWPEFREEAGNFFILAKTN